MFRVTAGKRQDDTGVDVVLKDWLPWMRGKIKKEKQLKDQQAELRRKANSISKMVGVFWKSVEKIVRHNYTVQIEQKRQQARAKKLESFVSKHLKLSVRVAEELNTKSFVE